MVLFAHGSGSGRLSPRNQYVARALGKEKLATLLIDLLTEKEEELDDQTGELRFNIAFLAERLKEVCGWAEKSYPGMKLGLFGASTGAAAALVTAAELKSVQAVVSRGGRPDLAGASLMHVQAPTLLIVGGRDEVVIELNKKAYAELHCEKKIEIVPGATHLFEEKGALEQVSELAALWFLRFLQ